MRPSTLSPLWSYAVLIAAAVLLLTGLGSTPIYILDEAKNATCAREMLERGDMVVPTFNGALRTDKPPLHYYFMMVSYSIFGITPFAARLFSGIFGWLTVVLIYAFVRRYLGPRAAVLSAAALASSMHFVLQLKLATPDPYLIFFNTLALVLAFIGHYERKALPMLMAYAAVAFSVLAKGPVGIMLPGGALLLYLTWSRQWSFNAIKSLHPIPGALITLVIAVPWYVAVHFATAGAWTDGFFLKHNLQRYTDTMEGHGGFFLLMPLLLVLAFLPLSGHVVSAFVPQRREATPWYKASFAHPAVTFSASVALLVVVFFSFSSTKLPSYISPALPFAAVVVGHYFDRILSRGRLRAWLWCIPLAVALALLVGGYLGLSGDENVNHLAHLAYAFAPLVAGVALALLFGLLGKREWALTASVAGAMLTTAAVQWQALPRIYAENPVQRSLYLTEGKQTIAYKRFNAGYSFYLPGTVEVYEDGSAIEAHLAKNPHTVILTQERYLSDLDMDKYVVLFKQRDLFELAVTVVLAPKSHSSDKGG